MCVKVHRWKTFLLRGGGSPIRSKSWSFLPGWLLHSWPTSQSARVEDSKSRRRSWKARAEEEEGEAKGHPCTLDGVSALNVEGRGPFNGRAVSFSPPSSSSSSSLPVLFCEHLPDRPDQMPEDRPPSLQPPSSVDNSIISNNTQYEISQKRIHFMETSR